jgi:hypothetical protein
VTERKGILLQLDPAVHDALARSVPLMDSFVSGRPDAWSRDAVRRKLPIIFRGSYIGRIGSFGRQEARRPDRSAPYRAAARLHNVTLTAGEP